MKEYEIGNELSQSHFKGSWTAYSILIPISLGLIAISYSSSEILKLTWLQLLPLAVASIFLFLYASAFAVRYRGYNDSIFNRLRDIENETGMRLHNVIHKDDMARCCEWRMRDWKRLLFAFILIAWFIRLYFAPFVLS